MAEALIWGASGGIGSALVKTLKQDGWQVYAAARQEAKVPVEADFTVGFEAAVPSSMITAVRLLAQETEGLDLMVYAAGGMRANLLEKLDSAAWSEGLAINLSGVFHAIQASLPLLRTNAQVMVIGAHVDHLILPRMGAYVAAKAGLEPLMQIFQKEHRKLKFTLVRPPAVDTPFWENVPFNLPKTAIQPEQVARAILDHYHAGTGGTLDI